MAAILLSIVAVIGINILLSKARLAAIDEVSYNGRYALDKISDLISNASGVTAPVLGASSSSLTLSTAVSSTNPTIVNVSGGLIYVKLGSATAQPIISTEVSSTALTFTNLGITGDPAAVRTQLTLQYNNTSNRAEYNVSEAFATTANIRTQ